VVREYCGNVRHSTLTGNPTIDVLANHSFGLQSGADVVKVSFPLGAYIDGASLIIPLLGGEASWACAMQQREHRLLIFGERGSFGGRRGNLSWLDDA